MVELKPCPFCGGEAKISECSTMIEEFTGNFIATYKCGCDKCKIYFARESKFVFKCGEPKLICNGIFRYHYRIYG